MLELEPAVCVYYCVLRVCVQNDFAQGFVCPQKGDTGKRQRVFSLALYVYSSS